MKSIVYAALTILSISLFCSCSKEYTCTCTFADSSKNFDTKLEKMRKNDAVVVCNDFSKFVGNCAIK